MAKATVSRDLRRSSIFVLLVAAMVMIFFEWAVSKTEFRRTDTKLHSPSTGQTVASHDPRFRAADFYCDIPMSFEVNNGQEDPQVKYSSRGRDYRVFLTDEGAIFALRKGAHAATSSLSMNFRGENHDSHISGVGELAGATNYLLGRDPSKWKTGVANYARVKYSAIYPGIDLIYYGKDHNLEYDFVVQPNGRPSDIRIDLSGSEIQIDGQGDLAVRTADTDVRLHRPVAR